MQKKIGKALGDLNRLRIYTNIASRKELYVGELEACGMISKATVSHHLRILTAAGLIAFRPCGQHVFYRCVPSRLTAYRRFLARLVWSKHSVPPGIRASVGFDPTTFGL
jgi:ArsR family transcriptional regulator